MVRFKYEVEWLIKPFKKPSKMIKRDNILAESKKDAEKWVESIRKSKPKAYNIKIKELM